MKMELCLKEMARNRQCFKFKKIKICCKGKCLQKKRLINT